MRDAEEATWYMVPTQGHYSLTAVDGSQCPSKTFGGFESTKDLPDDVITFARGHPAMHNPVYPINNQPIITKTDVDYQFTQIVVDRVEAEDGQYDVMFIGTGDYRHDQMKLFVSGILFPTDFFLYS